MSLRFVGSVPEKKLTKLELILATCCFSTPTFHVAKLNQSHS